jgi:methanogenic corrinoid protein MtbC1
MWERRYGAVEPTRTGTNRRLYSDEDIERLTLLRRATLAGESIGQIASMPTEQLRDLVRRSAPMAPASESKMVDDSAAEYHLDRCVQAVRDFDANGLESRLLGASVAMGQQAFLEKVLEPLLDRTGQMWTDGRIKVAHEHLASAVVRSLLGSMVVTNRVNQSGPVLIATTPAGQLHEFGALMAAVTATSVGWRSIYLGPNLPAEDIAAAARDRGARAVVLSVVYPSDDPIIRLELKKLALLLGDEIRLIVGGRASDGYLDTIGEIGAARVADLSELKDRLAELRGGQGTQRAG